MQGKHALVVTVTDTPPLLSSIFNGNVNSNSAAKGAKGFFDRNVTSRDYSTNSYYSNNNNNYGNNSYYNYKLLSKNALVDYRMTVWSEVPVITGFEPHSGPTTGGTIVTLTGTVKDFVGCKFSSEMFSYVVPTVQVNHSMSNGQNGMKDDQVTCTTPMVATTGQHSLDLNYRNEAWISTRYTFNYYFTPLFLGGVNIPLRGLKKETDVYGEFFPEGQLYFKIHFSGSFVLLSGVRVSSSHIRCLKVRNVLQLFGAHHFIVNLIFLLFLLGLSHTIIYYVRFYQFINLFICSFIYSFICLFIYFSLFPFLFAGFKFLRYKRIGRIV